MPTSEHHKQYIGNRLVSYGLRIRMTTTWHRGRGDTAGYFTKVTNPHSKICDQT